MSLILDALRRADAERGRGAVPGLHTPQAVPAAAVTEEERSRLPLVGAALLGGALAAVAAGVWWTGRADVVVPAAVVLPAATAPVVPAQAAPSAAASVAAPAAPVPVPAPAPAPAVQEAQPVESLVPAAPPPPPAPPVPAPRAVEPAPRVAPAPAAGAPAAPSTQSIAPPAPPAAVPAAPAPAPVLAATPLQDLPASVRQQLPQMSVSGASYSSNPAYRMVIVNGQVLHEGDLAAPGVILESIAPHQVVLRGPVQRWAVPY